MATYAVRSAPVASAPDPFRQGFFLVAAIAVGLWGLRELLAILWGLGVRI